MSAGAVSFTHIIKASEPVASTIISPLFGVEMQVWMRIVKFWYWFVVVTAAVEVPIFVCFPSLFASVC